MLRLPSTIINVKPREVVTPYHLYMEGIHINFAVHSYRANAELFRSADDTTGNFPSRITIRVGCELDFSTHLFAMSILSKWGFREGHFGGSVVHAPYQLLIESSTPIKLWICT